MEGHRLSVENDETEVRPTTGQDPGSKFTYMQTTPQWLNNRPYRPWNVGACEGLEALVPLPTKKYS